MIRIEHLHKEYENVCPIKDLSTVINEGDVIAVIGPSGTGKSTFIRMINMLEKPTSGKIFLDNIEITDPNCNLSEIRRRIGMVFQSFNLFGHWTVIENIMNPQIDLLHKTRQEAYEKAAALLKTVGLSDKMLNYPSELSGGQKQRIAIARTLAMDPEVILFDEPTSALDPTMVGEVQDVIRSLAEEGRTMMIVTHEMNFARQISNRVFFMNEGGIYEEGTPEQIFETPQRENTRRFIRRLKVLELCIDADHGDYFDYCQEILRYCVKNGVTGHTTSGILSVFEELVWTVMLPKMVDDDRILFSAEYSPEKQLTEILVKFSGSAFDPENVDDKLALSILKGRCEFIGQEKIDEQPYENLLKIHVK